MYNPTMPSGIPLAPRIRTPSAITARSVKNAMSAWKAHERRMGRLRECFLGARTAHTSEGEAVPTRVNYAAYIVSVLKGYITGVPPEYACAEGDTYAEAVFEVFRAQKKPALDAELVEDVLIYGRAFELVYRAADGQVKSVRVSPEDAFVAYAGDVEEDSVFGAVRYAEEQEDGTVLYTLNLYTATDIQTWRSSSKDDGWTAVGSPVPHGFGRVPLIEYAANREFTSAFESIIALQDAANVLMDDRIEDKDAFVRAILVLKGMIIGRDAEEIREGRKSINRTRVLQMAEDGEAAYLEHSLDETQVEVLMDALESAIFRTAFCPNLSDESFSGNSSGVAMAYKLFGTDQRAAELAASFQKGFLRRVKLFERGSLPVQESARIDYSAVQIVFVFNAPQDLSYMASSLVQLVQTGIISKATARRQLAVIPDAEAEDEMVGKEADEATSRTAAAFLDDLTEE